MRHAPFRLGTTALLVLLMVAAAFTQDSAAQDSAPGHLRLIDRLDRPADGYCLDVLGVGANLRTDVPIFAHNCKSALTNDSAVAVTEDGRIRFVALDLCVTAFGVNGRALPGAPIILRSCGDRAAFFESDALQAFAFHPNGRVVLAGSDLCLAAGDRSATTYSTADRWRTLTVEACDEVPAARARWELNRGPF